MFCLHVYLCITFMPGALGGQEKEQEPWQLELTGDYEPPRGFWEPQPQVLCKNSKTS